MQIYDGNTQQPNNHILQTYYEFRNTYYKHSTSIKKDVFLRFFFFYKINHLALERIKLYFAMSSRKRLAVLKFISFENENKETSDFAFYFFV